MVHRAHITAVEAALVLDEELRVGDPVVERPQGAAVLGSPNSQVTVLTEQPCPLLLAESLVSKRPIKEAEEEGGNVATGGLGHVEAEANEQGRLVNEEDALTTLDAEDVAVPVAQ